MAGCGRNNWNFSLSPHDVIDGVAKGTRIIAITGGDDTNTYPDLVENHVTGLKARGIEAKFVEVPGASHNAVMRSEELKVAVGELLAGG